jgi:hypothetical protein
MARDAIVSNSGLVNDWESLLGNRLRKSKGIHQGIFIILKYNFPDKLPCK